MLNPELMQSIALAFLVGLSLFLPVLLSVRNPQDVDLRRRCLWIVWVVQGILTVLASLVLIAGDSLVLVGIGIGLLCCLCGVCLLNWLSAAERMA